MSNKKSRDQNMEPASQWNERNDAHLLSIIEEKLISIKKDIKNCHKASEKNRLKAKRAEYRDIYTKIKNGDYCGNIVLNQFLDAQEASKLAQQRQAEMKARLEAELSKDAEKKEKKKSKEEQKRAKYQKKHDKKEEKIEALYEGRSTKKGKKGKQIPEEEIKTDKIGKYVDAFTDVNFDYEGYFRKTRYYGKLVPFLSLILIVAVMGIFLLGILLPAQTLESIEFTTDLQVDSLITFKLGPESMDYIVPNDGNWPNGTWKATSEQPQLPIGDVYKNSLGQEPTEVFLYADLGMTSISVSHLDVLKAFFYTPLMSATRIDFIEDQPLVANKTSWFYVKFIRDRMDEITIQRNQDGKYDHTVFVKWVATYGTIYTLIFAIIGLLICFVKIIIQFFTYTSRNLHVFSFFTLLFTALAVFLPALLLVENIDFTDINETMSIIGAAFNNYFVLDNSVFMSSVGTISIGLLPLIGLGLLGVYFLIPVFFKNRLRLKPSFVPKGNRPHTFLRKEEITVSEEVRIPKTQNRNPGLIQLNPALLGGLTPAPQAPMQAQQKPKGEPPTKKELKKAKRKK